MKSLIFFILSFLIVSYSSALTKPEKGWIYVDTAIQTQDRVYIGEKSISINHADSKKVNFWMMIQHKQKQSGFGSAKAYLTGDCKSSRVQTNRVVAFSGDYLTGDDSLQPTSKEWFEAPSTTLFGGVLRYACSALGKL